MIDTSGKIDRGALPSHRAFQGHTKKETKIFTYIFFLTRSPQSIVDIKVFKELY